LVEHKYQRWCAPEPLLSLREYLLAYQVEELIADPFCTFDLLLLLPMIKSIVLIKVLYSVALAHFYFVAGGKYEVIHL
jgi:hypothetical protein